MLRVCFAAMMLSTAGCTAMVDSDVGSLGPRPVACRSGATFECTCSAGVHGLQTCNDQGKFSACRCGPGPAGRAGNGG